MNRSWNNEVCDYTNPRSLILTPFVRWPAESSALGSNSNLLPRSQVQQQLEGQEGISNSIEAVHEELVLQQGETHAQFVDDDDEGDMVDTGRSQLEDELEGQRDLIMVVTGSVKANSGAWVQLKMKAPLYPSGGMHAQLIPRLPTVSKACIPCDETSRSLLS